MNIKRFTAPTSREALAKARMAFGDGTLILSNRPTANGVEVVFGIPGVHTVELYRGLAASKIRHVTPRHEQGAGFMADGYARASGKPGVCCLITGPGLMNAATPIGQAFSDSVPMLVLASVNAAAMAATPTK